MDKLIKIARTDQFLYFFRPDTKYGTPHHLADEHPSEGESAYKPHFEATPQRDANDLKRLINSPELLTSCA